MYKRSINSILHKLKKNGTYRYFFQHDRFRGYYPEVFGNYQSNVVSWCSNDYLNMSHNSTVCDAAIDAIKDLGVGSGGTRNISGNHTLIGRVEESIAEFHDKEDGLVFNSGYNANLGTLQAIGKLFPDIIFLSDEENHNSMIEGMKGYEKRIWKHNSIKHLESELDSIPKHIPKIIVFESVYSMSGTIAPVEDIVKLAQKYNALTYCDEIHAVGMYGEHGKGICNQLNVHVDFIQAGFGKAFGCQGGYVVSTKDWIDVIRHLAHSFIFTTSNSIPNMAAVEMAIDMMYNKEYERKLCFKNVNIVRTLLKENNIHCVDGGTTHIIAIGIPGANRCKKVCDYLLDNGMYAQPIQYPTVPYGKERIRITPSHLHSEEQIVTFITYLKKSLSL